MSETIYAPFQPPFKYNDEGQWIEDSKGQRLLDMRGWGYLTGQGSEALGMDLEAAAEIQDKIGQHVTALMNEADFAQQIENIWRMMSTT